MRMLAITFRDFLGEFSTFAFLSLSLSLFCIVDDPLTVGKCPKWRIQPRHTLSSELSISGILSPAFFVSFFISAPISNLANSLRPIFAWFNLL